MGAGWASSFNCWGRAECLPGRFWLQQNDFGGDFLCAWVFGLFFFCLRVFSCSVWRVFLVFCCGYGSSSFHLFLLPVLKSGLTTDMKKLEMLEEWPSLPCCSQLSTPTPSTYFVHLSFIAGNVPAFIYTLLFPSEGCCSLCSCSETYTLLCVNSPSWLRCWLTLVWSATVLSQRVSWIKVTNLKQNTYPCRVLLLLNYPVCI